MLGPVAPGSLGITMPHEHTFLDVMREYRGDGLVHDRVGEHLLERRLRAVTA